MNTVAIDNQITVSLSDLARGVSDIFRKAEYSSITVTRNSKPIAIITPYNNEVSDAVALEQSKLTEYLTNAIKEQVLKKYKNKRVPSLEDQLSDI